MEDRAIRESADESQHLFTRDEVRGGLPARRAQALLFLIESRVAHLAARSERTMELFPTERSERELDLAFLEAFALGRDPPLKPGIQDLERFAPNWAHLVPANPRLRAAVAHLLGQKYVFTARAVPSIRSALGLDALSVADAFRRRYDRPLTAIYAPSVPPLDRLRWAWAALGRRLAALPPFWTAFLFTFSLGVPQAILAVPIAVAPLGPLAGIGLTLVAALISFVTVACIAEACARSGLIRYGTAYTGRLASDFLGPAGSGLFTLALYMCFLLTVAAGFFAISGSLAQITSLPRTVLTALLFGGGIYLLARGSVSFSFALLTALGSVIAVLLITAMALIVSHSRLERLADSGAALVSLDPARLQTTVGVVLMAFFAQGFVVQCAKVVLPRDPSGRSLIWGSLAGTAAIAALVCAWILVVNGSLPSEALAAQAGTVFGPLSAVTGPAIGLLGFLLVLLLPGLAALRCLIAAYNQTREWLPARPSTILALPRGRGQLLLRQADRSVSGLRLSLTYLGLDSGQARFALVAELAGAIRREELAVVGRWDLASLYERWPELRGQRLPLTLNLLQATESSVRLEVTSPLEATCEGEWDLEAAIPLLPATAPGAGPGRPTYLSDRTRFLVGILPIGVVFLLAELLIIAELDSFAGVLSILGVLSNSIFAGVIPVLLLVASRRKGEVVPGVGLSFLGDPRVVGGIYLLYMLILLAHGLIIWQDPAARAAALLTAAAAAAATIVMVRGGAFNCRLVVELREDLRRGERSAFAVTGVGRPLEADVWLEYAQSKQHCRSASGEVPEFSTLRRATFELPTGPARELKVWVHRVTPAGASEALPAVAQLQHAGETRETDLKLSGGQALLPIDGQACRVTIILTAS